MIQAEDDIKRNIAIVDLLERFVTVENEEIFNSFRDRREHIRLLSSRDTFQVTFSEYIRTVSDWLRHHRQIIDDTIKPLCGRSLRRMKVYGIRLYASPIVATLALLESKKIGSKAYPFESGHSIYCVAQDAVRSWNFCAAHMERAIWLGM